MFKQNMLIKKAQNKQKTIVFPEAGYSERTILAIKKIVKKKIAKAILIGDESALVLRYKKLKNVTIINPKTSALTPELAEVLYELRKEKGLTKLEAEKLILDPHYFATMLVQEGYADGMVGGAEVSTATNLRPALQIIKTKKDVEVATSCFLFFGKNKITKNQPFIMGDCALVVKPTQSQLVCIAEQCMEAAEIFANVKAKIAFLSYSTNGSAESEENNVIKNATKSFKQKHSLTFCEGEVQLDTALIPEVAKNKFPKSKLATCQANVFILPNVMAGNICYKAVQYFGNLTAVGPITLGLNKPVNDLSRGCTVDDIILITAITVLQCENKKEK